jgi:glycosyltransferase involved in cell wall biosynthesis
MLDLWISLTPAGAELLRQRYPILRLRKSRVIAHGTYRDAYDRKPDRRSAEGRLGIEPVSGSTFLLLGQIRRYKNALPLLRAFLTGAAADDRLIIAGEVREDEGLADALVRAASGDPRVVLRLVRVTESDIPLWHAVSDVVVLPYDMRSALNSGALMLALAMDVPVVATDSEINRELRDRIGGEWIRLYRGGPDAALLAARSTVATQRATEPDLEAFEWSAIVDTTLNAYRELAGRE